MQLLAHSFDRSFSVNFSYALSEKPASAYSDEVHHSVPIAGELVSEYGIRGVAAYSTLQHSWDDAIIRTFYRLVEGTTSVAESAERRRRRVSTSDVRRKLAARQDGAVP